jgi:hypothetical protein
MNVLEELRPYQEQMKDLPLGAFSFKPAPASLRDRYHGLLALKTDVGNYELLVVEFKTHLSHDVASRLVESVRAAKRPVLVLAPYVGRSMGQRLAAAGVSYLDRQGNCHLAIGRKLLFHVEGRTAPREQHEARGIRAPGYQVLFALLAEPSLLRATVRDLAAASGSSRTAVSQIRRRLLAERYLLETRSGLQWAPRRREDALSRWIEGYRSAVRPRLLVGTYRTPDRTPADLEERLTPVLDDEFAGWRFGGSAAGHRLTGYYRSEQTAIHLRTRPARLPAAMRGLPDRNGNLVVLLGIGTVAWPEDRDIVHPLLVYSEMLATGDERAREAADEIYEKHIVTAWNRPASP